jgi:hypothetical protein
LRTLPYVRAWHEKYERHGLTVIGVHTPEFVFEGDVDNVRRALRDMNVEFPIVMDNGYAIWEAFANHYWPALYFVDGEGRIRHHRFGEGEYDSSERVIQELLADAEFRDVPDDIVVVEGVGAEAPADWNSVRSGETYLGYERSESFGSPGLTGYDERRAYTVPSRLHLNQWALEGDWTVRRDRASLHSHDGRIAFRFHARDVHLIMGASERHATVPVQVRLDGEPPGAAHGVDVDNDGIGSVAEPRMYQLIRQTERIKDRLFEIEFPDGGAEAFAFTFG